MEMAIVCARVLMSILLINIFRVLSLMAISYHCPGWLYVNIITDVFVLPSFTELFSLSVTMGTYVWPFLERSTWLFLEWTWPSFVLVS